MTPARLLLVPQDRDVPACKFAAVEAVSSKAPRNALALAAIANLLAESHQVEGVDP